MPDPVGREAGGWYVGAAPACCGTDTAGDEEGKPGVYTGAAGGAAAAAAGGYWVGIIGGIVGTIGGITCIPEMIG